MDTLNLYTRETLLAYFAARHEQHEQMRLLELTINREAGVPREPVINFRITRTADDLPETIFGGKGGVGCTQGRIFLWSQGGRSGSAATPTVTAPVATRALQSATPTPGGATLSARQAQEVATLTAFLTAYNAGDLDATLAAIAEPWGWSDCDYARGYGDRGGPGYICRLAWAALRGSRPVNSRANHHRGAGRAGDGGVLRAPHQRYPAGTRLTGWYRTAAGGESVLRLQRPAQRPAARPTDELQQRPVRWLAGILRTRDVSALANRRLSHPMV